MTMICIKNCVWIHHALCVRVRPMASTRDVRDGAQYDEEEVPKPAEVVVRFSETQATRDTYEGFMTFCR